MSFEIDRRERDGAVILAPRGRLVIGEPVESFRSALEELFNAAHIRVVLDFRHVNYIDSSALGCLVVAHTRFTKAGGAMPLFGLNRRTVELLVITKLATIFRIAQDEMEAVNLCFPGRGEANFDILDFVEGQQGRTKEDIKE